MGIFLQILGIIALLTIIAGGYFAYRIWRAIQRLKGSDSSTTDSTPREIHLVSDEARHEWTQNPEVAAILSEAQRWGLLPGDTFSIAEMEGVRLLPLFATHEEGPACGVIYDHPEQGNWLDLVIIYEDGTSLTISNAPEGSEIESPPESEKVYLEGQPASRLFEVMVKRFEQQPVVFLRPSNFVAEFENAYREEMEWRLDRGTTEGEVRAVAKRMGQDASASEIQQTLKVVRGDEFRELFEQYRDRFIAETDLSVAEWVRCEEHLIFVTDQVKLEFFTEYVEEYFSFSDEQQNWLASATEQHGLRVAFGQLNASLPIDQQARKLGTIQHLVVADVYCGSAEVLMEAMAA